MLLAGVSEGFTGFVKGKMTYVLYLANGTGNCCFTLASHGGKFLLDTFYGMIKLGNGKWVFPKP